MSISDPQKAQSTESTRLSGWAVAVREGLSGRSRAPTPAEERRLAKTLERLHPAANVALAGAAALNGQAHLPAFPTVLAHLSDA